MHTNVNHDIVLYKASLVYNLFYFYPLRLYSYVFRFRLLCSPFHVIIHARDYTQSRVFYP